MRWPFEDSELVAAVRNTGGGLALPWEIAKLLVVIPVADALTNRVPDYVIRHGIEPFASMEGIWLVGIGLLSVVALAYMALWEHMLPKHAGVCLNPPKSALGEFAKGYGAGGLIMALIVFASLLLGGFQMTLNLAQANALAVIRIAAIYVFQAFGEEVLYRGTCTMCMARKSPAMVAVLVSSVLFSAHHHFNPGYGPVAFVNLALLGLLLGVTVLHTNRIWMATAIHAAWNFFQGNVFGVNVSGAAANPESTLLVCSANEMPLVTGGQMGLEGSLVATVVLVAALAVLWHRAQKLSSQ